MLTLRSTTPISSSPRRLVASSSSRGGRRASIAIFRASADKEEDMIGRREALLGGAAAAGAAAMPKRALADGVPPPPPTTSASASASPEGAGSPPSRADGSAAFNCEPRETPVRLGNSELLVAPLAVGAWSWGDKTAYWGYSSAANAEFGRQQCLEAFRASLEAGITFLDTAEAYGGVLFFFFFFSFISLPLSHWGSRFERERKNSNRKLSLSLVSSLSLPPPTPRFRRLRRINRFLLRGAKRSPSYRHQVCSSALERQEGRAQGGAEVAREAPDEPAGAVSFFFCFFLFFKFF